MPFDNLPLYFENAAGQLREHPAGYAIVYYLPGKRQPKSFEALGTQAGHLLLARRWNRLLSDQRELSPLSEVEKAWITEEWLTQRVARPSLLWEAVLVPVDVFARLSMTQTLNQKSAASSAITLHSFVDEALAHAFLIEAVSKLTR